jgi:pimeloyl-ACP methyl ester carboxylesterase
MGKIELQQKIRLNNFYIKLSIWGDAKNPVIGIHGISSNSQVWREIAKAISKHFVFIAPDLRGRGHSDSPGGYNLINHANDIKSILNKLHFKKAIIMGHSLGAYIAIVFASLFPEHTEKVVLLDGGAKLSPKQAKKVFNAIKISLERLGKIYNSFEEYISYMKQAPFLKPWYPPLEDYYKYELITLENGKVKSRVKKETISEEAENLKQFDISEHYKKIECPVLVLRATKGMITDDDHLLTKENIKEMEEKIKNIKIVEIPETNHYTIAFYPNEYRDKIILDFLLF